MVKRPKAKGDGTDIWMHSKMKPVDFHLLILESIYFLFFSLSPFIFILNNTAEIMQSYYMFLYFLRLKQMPALQDVDATCSPFLT